MRVMILGATGALGRHMLRQALAAGHDVRVIVRSPDRLPADLRERLDVHVGDLALMEAGAIAALARGQDAVIATMGHVREGATFVALFAKVVDALETLGETERPVVWMLGGAALLDLDGRGRRGVDLALIGRTYWPHARNLERLRRSPLDWRLLCPGPMTDDDALDPARLRRSTERLPLLLPGFASVLPGPALALLFARHVPELTIPYANAAAFVMAHLTPGGPLSRRRVGLALPAGMRGRKP